MRYVIIDDEPLAHDVIETYAAKLAFLEKVGNCHDAIEALNLLNDETVDLLFLDIRMPKLEGFDFLRTLKRPPQVIAVSAHSEYALEGYELDICDYLLKPYSFERFLRAVNKAKERFGGEQSKAEPEAHETLFVKDGKKRHQVALDDLLFIEACGNFSMVHTATGKIMCSEKISELEGRLPSVFVRIHKSFLVASRKIEVVEGEELVVAGKRLPIGRVYKANITELMR